MLSWMNISERGAPSAHTIGLAEQFARVAAPDVRRKFCVEAFEANPYFNSALARVAAQIVSETGTYVNVHNATAFALRDGLMPLGLDAVRHDGSSLVLSKHVKPDVGRRQAMSRVATVGESTVTVRTVGSLSYIRSLPRDLRIVLKIDVEGYEFHLLRSLVPSGVLCRRVSDLLIEWHGPRHSSESGWRQVIDTRREGMPHNSQIMQRVLSWAIKSPDCATRLHQWG